MTIEQQKVDEKGRRAGGRKIQYEDIKNLPMHRLESVSRRKAALSS